MLGKFLALTVECQLRLVALSKKEDNTVITVCVLTNTSKKEEILEPAVLDVDYSCCLKIQNFHLTGSHYTVTLSLVSAVQLFDNIEPCLKLYS